ncbi:MAG: bacteriophage holin [Chlamydiae bacterium]|nr:bacteriophage holin [Chlamydiota bacterium]
MKEEKYQKISNISLALAIGIVWGGFALLAGWCSILGWGIPFVKTMGGMYVAYASSFWGGIIGGIWAFIDGFIGGLLISILYNIFRKIK